MRTEAQTAANRLLNQSCRNLYNDPDPSRRQELARDMAVLVRLYVREERWRLPSAEPYVLGDGVAGPDLLIHGVPVHCRDFEDDNDVRCAIKSRLRAMQPASSVISAPLVDAAESAG